VNIVAIETVFLLVEDNPHDAFFVKREFSRSPSQITLRVTSDGAEAIDYLMGEGKYADRFSFPIPNVIFLDLKMPRIGGFEFLHWLRSKAPGRLRMIPVVVMSSSSLERDVQRAYELGVNSYLVKPVEWHEFRKLISDLGIYWTERALTPRF
jgi:CheY-like chemotaxis protein